MKIIHQVKDVKNIKITITQEEIRTKIPLQHTDNDLTIAELAAEYAASHLDEIYNKQKDITPRRTLRGRYNIDLNGIGGFYLQDEQKRNYGWIRI